MIDDFGAGIIGEDRRNSINFHRSKHFFKNISKIETGQRQ